jgi:hypothetical protein
MVSNYPVQAIDLPVRDERSLENDDEKKIAENEASARASDETRAAEHKKEDLGKADLGKNVDETA